ncbi:MAG TPA: META domain-containing protein [Anaerolineales bacterium]|nr:META domain-containing protein [Anaerolineales bacterium]
MKTNASFLLTLLMFTVMLISACAGGASSLGGEWELVSYGDASAPMPALPGVDTSIAFGSDGQFGGNVGCNGFGAEYKVSGNKVTFDAVMSTMMYCEETADQEGAVIGMLSEATMTFELDGGVLTLTSTDGSSVLVLVRK